MVRDLLVHGCFEKQMLRESSDSCVDFSNGVESSKSRYTENVSESSSDSDRFRPLKKLGQSLDVRKAISSKIFSNGVSKANQNNFICSLIIYCASNVEY